MRSKWTRILAAALAVTLTVPTSLPANALAAKTVTKDENAKKVSASTAYDYSYLQIGSSDIYLRYVSEYSVNPGQTVEMTTHIVRQAENGEYTLVADTAGYTYEWSREVIEDGYATGTYTSANISTASMKADSDKTWFDNNGYSYYQLDVTHDGDSTYAEIRVELDLPYTIADDNNDNETFYRMTGDSVTFHTGIQVDPGYTAEYKWEQYIADADGNLGAAPSAPASVNTSTDPSKYSFTISKDSDYGQYICTVSVKDANQTVQAETTMKYTVVRDDGLVMYNTYQTYKRLEGTPITLALDGMSYDATNYKVKYVWYKDGEKLTNALPTYEIKALTKEDFAASYYCNAYIFKSTATDADMDALNNVVDSVYKYFDINQITGLWAYTGDYEIETPISTKVVLEAYATNLDATKYPITYKWYKYAGEVWNEDDNRIEEKWDEVAGQTGSTYTMESITTEQFGKYKVVISDTVATKELKYNVTEDYGWKVNTPTYNVLYKNIGESVDLSVNVTSAANYPITYKWYKGDKVISGAIAATYSLSITKDVDFKEYRCVVTNGKQGCKSTIYFDVRKNDNFYVDALTYPTQYVKEGSSATFQVRAGSDDAAATYEYQWYFSWAGDMDNWGSGYKQIPGQKTDTLTISSVALANYGSYRCKVTNTKTNEYEYEYFDLKLHSNVVLEYATESVFNVTKDNAVSMGVTPVNPENMALTYVWGYKKDSYDDYDILDGQTTTTLSLPAVKAGQYGYYVCYALYNNIIVASKEFRVKTDSKEYLEVKAATDTNQEVALGAAINFGVTATTKEGRTLTYQWYEGYYDNEYDYGYNDSKAIYGATTATYTVAAARKSDMKSYCCVVSDGEERETVHFSVKEKSALTFTWDGGCQEESGAVSIEGTAGKALNLAVTTVDDSSYPTQYRWYYCGDSASAKSANIIAGANTSSYNIASLGKTSVGYYACNVHNAIASYTVWYYVYFNTGLTVKAAENEFEVALGEKVPLSATVSSDKKYPATMQWYKYDEDYEHYADYGYTEGGYVAIPGATKAKYDIASVTEKDFTTYKLEVTTDGEKKVAYFYVEEKPAFSIEKITSSTDATLPGSEITLKATVNAPKGAKVTYKWYAEDAITGDDIHAKNVDGKDANTANVTVAAPTKIDPDSIISDAYENITYTVVAETVVDGKTTKASASYRVMVVDPEYSSKAPKSEHNYKAGRTSVYGYKAAGNVTTMKAKFNKKTSIDKTYGDYMYVIDGTGKSSRYYGTELQNKTLSIAGNKFAVVIVSNNKESKGYGFEVSKVSTSTKAVTPSKLTLGVKEKHKITGVLSKKQAKKAKYTSSKKNVVKVNKKGVLQAKKVGTAKVTIKVGKKKVKTITVVVKKAPKKLKAAKKSVTIKRGKSASVKLTLNPAGSASYGTAVKNAKALKKAKISSYVADGKVTIKVAKNAKKKTYKVQVSTYNKKKATIKVKVK